jgi:hypothetical protein
MKFQIVEGLSNFNDELRQDVLELFKREWENCKKKKKSGKWLFKKTYTEKTTGKKIHVKIAIVATRLGKNKHSYAQSIVSKHNVIWFVISLNLTEIIDSSMGKYEGYYTLLSQLEHEITHVSQRLNKSMSVDQKRRKKMDFKSYVNVHPTFPTEKEASLVELFSLIKNYTPVFALRFFISHLPYWRDIGFGYKTFLKKAADYGLTNKEIAKFMLFARTYAKKEKADIPMLDIIQSETDWSDLETYKE